MDPTADGPDCWAWNHGLGPCPVDGLEDLVEEIQQLAMIVAWRREARVGPGGYDWRVIAEDADVCVIIPA